MKVGQGGRSEGGREGVTAGHIRRQGYRFSFFVCLFVFETRFPCSDGVYSKDRGSVYRSLSQAGNRRK